MPMRVQWTSLFFTIVIVSTAVVTGILFGQTTVPGPLAALTFAVALAAWRGGLWQGLLAEALGVIAAAYFFFPPRWSFTIANPEHRTRLFLFIVTAAIISITAEARLRMKRRMQIAAEREHAELSRKIRETEERFRIMADTAPVMIWVTNAAGDLQFVNRVYREFFGLDTDLPRNSWQPLLHPEDREQYVDAYAKALDKKATFQAEARVRRHDGAWRWVSSFGSPRFSHSGEFLGHVGTSPDITDRKDAEEQVRRSEDRFRVALERSPTIVYTTDRDLRYTWIFNPSAGFQAENVVGKTDRDLLPEENVADLMAFKEQVLLSGIGARRTIEVATPIGRMVYDVAAEPLRDGAGNVTGLSVAANDVSALALAKSEAEAANHARDQFLATISHELRTPMTSILGWTAMLEKGMVDAELMPTAVAAIASSARVQQQLIDDLLDVSRIASGKLTVDLRPVSINDVVRTTVEGMRASATAAGIALDLDLPSVPLIVAGDTIRVQQVLGNLLSNALKFTPAGGRVEVSARRIGRDLRISVRDTGKGIDKDFLPHVFERFAQEERGRGLGLGLAIVHDIVALHGGTVAAESEGPGRGSTFHVTLPIISAEEKDRHFDAVRSVNLSGRSVLVVDDDPPVLEMLEAAITGAGARVISASTCAAAMNSIESAPPDVVVSDLLMPFEDGFALIQRLRVHDAEKQRHTHAIAISAMPPQETRERTREAGYDAFIAKPLDPAVLIREISRLLAD